MTTASRCGETLRKRAVRGALFALAALTLLADPAAASTQRQGAASRERAAHQRRWPACDLIASPQSIPWGGSSLLTWTSTQGVSATLEGFPVPLNGSLVVSPIAPKTYTLRVWGSKGTTPAVSSVTVSPPELECRDDQACPVLCGSGWIEDVLTGDPLLLSPADMVHVVILPEGYTQHELDAGIFDQDVEDWIDEWLAVDPYGALAEAFCIWKLPVASNEHVAPTAPQSADTAFLVPITPDGEGVGDIPLDGPTAQRVWSALDGFPFPPSSFYPPGGRTSRVAKNLVVVVLVYDVAAGRSGLDGLSRRLQNPADPDQRLSTAFAHRRAHEFTHAFARLKDEYIEDGDGPVCTPNALAIDSANLSNVVCDPDCASLPWAHLLVGTPVNPWQDELVGSFGVSSEGFHPELKCLMNGRHDNATYFGGDGDLGVPDRLCNYCREVVAFRLLERVHVLDDPTSSYGIWSNVYRDPFYARFGFVIPDPVPQENSEGTPIYHPCAGGPDLPRGSAPARSRPACDIDDGP